MGAKMSYTCPVDGCEYEGKQTALMNHLRMTQDSGHTEMYQRFKGGSTDNNDSNDVDQEEPKLEESFNEAMEDQDQEQDSGMEVTKLGSSSSNDSEDSQETEKVDIEEAEIEELAENTGLSPEKVVKALQKGLENGMEKVDMETGDMS